MPRMPAEVARAINAEHRIIRRWLPAGNRTLNVRNYCGEQVWSGQNLLGLVHDFDGPHRGVILDRHEGEHKLTHGVGLETVKGLYQGAIL